MKIDLEALKGTTIEDQYFLEEIIGKGGMGVVYKAHDKHFNRDVAIKMLIPRMTEQISRETYSFFLERFRREAEVMKLSHPNIVPVYHTGVVNNVAYLVMPYIEGRTLAAKLMSEGALPVRQALRYIEQVADALNLAHSKGIIHRDLKPRNFLLDTQDRLFVSDFGIAHLEGSTLTQTGEFLGTRGYAAPEVQRGGKIDQRADIYSLGIILFELLVGVSPSQAGSRIRLPSVEIEAIIDKAVAERPQDRYPTALAFTQALRQARDALHNDPTDFSSTDENISLSIGTSKSTPVPSHATGPSPLSYISLSSRYFLPLIALGVLLFVLFGMIFFIRLRPSSTVSIITAPLSSSTPTEILHSVEQAKQLVQQYYTDWNQKNYQAAYALLDTAYQQNYSYAQFLPYYQHTHESCLSIDRSIMLPDGSIKVFITDSAVEDDPSSAEKTVVHVYQGYYLVRQYVTGMQIIPYLSIQADIVGNCPKSS